MNRIIFQSAMRSMGRANNYFIRRRRLPIACPASGRKATIMSIL
ncbi:MAG: hypothetical protein R6V76_15405 [Desulfobacterales bacterium]